MECAKCKGLMISERFSDYFFTCYAWKCLNCGAVVDPTIAQNRRRPPSPETPEPVSP